MIQLLDPAAGNKIHITRITGVEVVSAITRNGVAGNLTSAAVTTALLQFRHDFAHRFHQGGMTLTRIFRAMDLAELHALRGYDAVQLATALHINGQRLRRGVAPLILISADGDLNAAALTEGLAVDDPNSHP